MKFCSHCGASVDDEDGVCSRCGHELNLPRNKAIAFGGLDENIVLRLYRYISLAWIIVGMMILIIALSSLEDAISGIVANLVFIVITVYFIGIMAISLYSFRLIIVPLFILSFYALSYFSVVGITNFIAVFILIIAIAFLVGSMFLSCRKYDYKGQEIVVYAGWFRNYIKVNGIKFDEHNTFFNLVPLHLSCKLSDGSALSVTISMTNRIALKINDKLYLKTKKR